MEAFKERLETNTENLRRTLGTYGEALATANDVNLTLQVLGAEFAKRALSIKSVVQTYDEVSRTASSLHLPVEVLAQKVQAKARAIEKLVNDHLEEEKAAMELAENNNTVAQVSNKTVAQVSNSPQDPKSPKSVLLFMAIYTAYGEKALSRRAEIRRTYMQHRLVQPGGPIIAKFVVGFGDHATKHEEAVLEQDVVHYPAQFLRLHVDDRYESLTKKTWSLLRWFTMVQPAKWLLKLDDDTFPHIDHIHAGLLLERGRFVQLGLVFDCAPVLHTTKWAEESLGCEAYSHTPRGRGGAASPAGSAAATGEAAVQTDAPVASDCGVQTEELAAVLGDEAADKEQTWATRLMQLEELNTSLEKERAALEALRQWSLSADVSGTASACHLYQAVETAVQEKDETQMRRSDAEVEAMAQGLRLGAEIARLRITIDMLHHHLSKASTEANDSHAVTPAEERRENMLQVQAMRADKELVEACASKSAGAADITRTEEETAALREEADRIEAEIAVNVVRLVKVEAELRQGRSNEAELQWGTADAMASPSPPRSRVSMARGQTSEASTNARSVMNASSNASSSPTVPFSVEMHLEDEEPEVAPHGEDLEFSYDWLGVTRQMVSFEHAVRLARRRRSSIGTCAGRESMGRRPRTTLTPRESLCNEVPQEIDEDAEQADQADSGAASTVSPDKCATEEASSSAEPDDTSEFDDHIKALQYALAHIQGVPKNDSLARFEAPLTQRRSTCTRFGLKSQMESDFDQAQKTLEVAAASLEVSLAKQNAFAEAQTKDKEKAMPKVPNRVATAPSPQKTQNAWAKKKSTPTLKRPGPKVDPFAALKELDARPPPPPPPPLDTKALEEVATATAALGNIGFGVFSPYAELRHKHAAALAQVAAESRLASS